MNHKFLHVDEDKRDKLIVNGFKEFSIHGKKRASLNNILRTSKMSKGVFYHYFKDKDDFYYFLVQFSGNYLTSMLEEESLLTITDFIDRTVKSMVVKSSIYKKYPYFSDFLTNAYKQDDIEEIKEIMSKENNDFSIRFLTENLDFSKYVTNDRDALIRVTSRYLHGVYSAVLIRITQMELTEIETYLINEVSYLKKVIIMEEQK